MGAKGTNISPTCWPTCCPTCWCRLRWRRQHFANIQKCDVKYVFNVRHCTGFLTFYQCWRDVGQQYQISLILLANISPTSRQHFWRQNLAQTAPTCWSPTMLANMLARCWHRLRLPLHFHFFPPSDVKFERANTWSTLNVLQEIQFELWFWNLAICFIKGWTWFVCSRKYHACVARPGLPAKVAVVYPPPWGVNPEYRLRGQTIKVFQISFIVVVVTSRKLLPAKLSTLKVSA